MFRGIILLVALLFVQNICAVPKKILERIIDNRAKSVHAKADEIDQRIAAAFVKAGYKWGECVVGYGRDYFEINQHKYPEPIVLLVSFSKEIRKDLIAEDIPHGQECWVNSFVNFDRKQKRFMVKATEIICKWKVNIDGEGYVWKKFKADIKGKAFDVDFEEGLRANSKLNPDIESDVNPKIKKYQGMYIYFEENNSKSEQQDEN